MGTPHSSTKTTQPPLCKADKGVLSLSRMALIDEDLSTVISGDLKQVKTLILRENYLNGEGFTVLTANTTLQLLKLNIACNALTDQSLRYLSDAQWELKELMLNKNNITGYGLKYLNKLRLKQLQQLNLNENFIEDRGAAELLLWECPSLRHFLLFGNCLKDKGVIVLLNWKVPALTRLHLADNCHTSAAIIQLLRAHWPAIEELQLYGDLVPHWEKESLRELLQVKWPHSQIFI